MEFWTHRTGVAGDGGTEELPCGHEDRGEDEEGDRDLVVAFEGPVVHGHRAGVEERGRRLGDHAQERGHLEVTSLAGRAARNLGLVSSPGLGALFSLGRRDHRSFLFLPLKIDGWNVLGDFLDQ